MKTRIREKEKITLLLVQPHATTVLLRALSRAVEHTDVTWHEEPRIPTMRALAENRKTVVCNLQLCQILANCMLGI
jgi:hypothetical protein